MLEVLLNTKGNEILHATFVTCRQGRILLQKCWARNTIETALEFQVQVVQKVAHEFVGILLLIAPGTNRKSVMGEGPRAQPSRQEGKALGSPVLRAQRGSWTFHPHLLHVLHTKFLNKEKKLHYLKTSLKTWNIRANWICSDLHSPHFREEKNLGAKKGHGGVLCLKSYPDGPVTHVSLWDGLWIFPLAHWPLYKMLKC